MSVAIRVLGASDEAVLCRVAEDVFDGPVDAARTREFLRDPRHHVVVALDEDRVVGFASGVHYLHPDKEPELFVLEVGVAPAHRRRGVARRLVEQLLAEGRSRGCRNAWVATEPDNEAARALYASAGGAEDETPFVMFTFSLS